MARIRSIKPDFFTDSDVTELSPLHRLLFQGLWCHADRAGRLEDKPRELKVRILPFDNCDVDAMLTDLANAKHGRGFIVRYEVEGRRFIQCLNFEKHQHCHKDEKATVLPPVEHGARTVLPPHKPGASAPISCLLSPVSGLLASGAGGSAVADEAPPAKPPPPKIAEKPSAAPVFYPLIERLTDAYQREKGSAYPLDSHVDGLAVRRLFGLTQDEAEIERRWLRALRRTTYPACGTLAELAQQKVWSAAATDPPARTGTTNGRATDADKDWSKEQPTTDDGKEIRW